MKTLVIGGTGFLGRHIVEMLLNDNHQVTVLSRSPERAAERLHDSVHVVQGDVSQLDKKALTELISSFDGLVYAAGADERTAPDTNARDFYYRENVEYCRKVLLATRETNVSHVVLLNSIFTHINRTQPELDLTQHHPYIDSRVKQSEMALAASKGSFTLTVLEIPWVFGSSFDQESQWSVLVNYVRGAVPLVSPRGGTVAISARNVARAAVGALTRPTQSASFPIGDCNISWDQLLLTLSELSGRNGAKITRLPDAVVAGVFRMGALGQTLLRANSGLDFSKMHEFLLEENYINSDSSQMLLGYGDGEIKTALYETVCAVPEGRVLNLWRKLSNAVSTQDAAEKPSRSSFISRRLRPNAVGLAD